MNRQQRIRIKQRGILLSLGGLSAGLVIILVFREAGFWSFDLDSYFGLAAVVLVVHGLLWAAPALGWDRAMERWDPHYIFGPQCAFGVLLSLFVYLLPEARILFLHAFLLALLFLTGIGGFREVMGFSVLMAVGYLGAILGLSAEGFPLVVAYEAALAGLLLVLGVIAGVVLQRAYDQRQQMYRLRRELEDLALTDPLTGLPNRRQLEERLPQEIDRLRRYGGTSAMAMIDVDFFKRYNDRHGHLAGDRILEQLGRLVRAWLRRSDVANRYGGEEFSVIVVDADLSVGVAVLERLREAVRLHDWEAEAGVPGGITISVGVTEMQGDDDPVEVLRRADEALYEAKERGRDRVEAWKTEGGPALVPSD